MKKVLALTLAAMLVFAGCGSNGGGSSAAPAPASSAPASSGAASQSEAAEVSTVSAGKFTVGMECAYPPFNWTQLEQTDTSVDIGSASYADGYDVMMSKYIAEKLGLEVVIKPIAWEGLEPALNSGEIDAIIAGMTATPERQENADFTTPYYDSHSKMVVIVKADSDLVNIKSLAELSGKNVLGQVNTLYDTAIDQIPEVNHLTPLATYPLMVESLKSGDADALTAELNVAEGVVAAHPELAIVQFDEGKGFDIDTTVSIAVKKGNTALLDAIQGALDTVDDATRLQWMDDATARQPATE